MPIAGVVVPRPQREREPPYGRRLGCHRGYRCPTRTGNFARRWSCRSLASIRLGHWVGKSGGDAACGLRSPCRAAHVYRQAENGW